MKASQNSRGRPFSKARPPTAAKTSRCPSLGCMLFISKKRLHLRMNTIKIFLHKDADHVTGVLSGFDRLLFRSWLRHMVFSKGSPGSP
jgi:hypothetical protein